MDATRDRQTDINTLPVNGFRLVTLGSLTLVDARGVADQALAKRRRKLAVLAVLAMNRRPVSRERLAEMFWGDEEESRARHSLSDALSGLRRVLGPDSIATRQLEVSLSPTCPLAVDALELIASAERRDHTRVVAMYGGEFLETAGANESATFEHWAYRVRDQLRRHWLEACAHECLALARARKWSECAILARRWLDDDPISSDAALYLLNAIKAAGSPEAYRAALDEYELLERRLDREFEQSPPHDVAQLAESIRSELGRIAPPLKAASGDLHETVVIPSPQARNRDLPEREAHSPTTRRLIPSRFASIPLATLLFLASTSFTASRAASRPAYDRAARPSVVVADVRNVSGDSATAWLELGLPQMVALDIARVSGIDVISPERVRQARASLGYARGAALTRENLVRLGARTGAGWLVTGGITHGDSLYVLDVTVQDTAGSLPPRLFTVTSSSLIALADQAAAKLAGLATAGGSAPGFADVETSSIEAYQHYVRARQAADEGRGADATRELDAAIALDSSFVSAIADRITGAMSDGELQVVRHLRPRLASSLEHAAPFDRMRDATERAFHNGEHCRAELLAEALVDRYPRDPRAYALLADVFTSHGRWDPADSVLTHELALDSLATFAGAGPCAPCVAYSGLSMLRAERGDMHGAVYAAQRWVALQPDVPGAWSSLMSLLSFDGRFDAALDAHRRAGALTPSANYTASLARILIMARRFEEADTVIARALDAGRRSRSHEAMIDALDVRALLERERGELRRSARTVDSAMAVDSGAAALRLMAANSLARVGDYALARAIYAPPPRPGSPVRAITAGDARGFAWHHALLADAIAPVADTMELRALADSIERIGAWSFYARDWRLAHHVRGLIAMRAGDYARAEREFSSSRWGISGWTVSVVDAARAQLSLGRPSDAVRTLREAYVGPLDAMGRYEPRSEIDYWMSKAFAQGGQTDSARVYASYVRQAWQLADPEVKAKLQALIK